MYIQPNQVTDSSELLQAGAGAEQNCGREGLPGAGRAAGERPGAPRGHSFAPHWHPPALGAQRDTNGTFGGAMESKLFSPENL